MNNIKDFTENKQLWGDVAALIDGNFTEVGDVTKHIVSLKDCPDMSDVYDKAKIISLNHDCALILYKTDDDNNGVIIQNRDGSGNVIQAIFGYAGEARVMMRTISGSEASDWQDISSGWAENVVTSSANGLASSSMFNRILQQNIYSYSNVAPDGADHYDQLASHLVEWCPEPVPILRPYATNDGNYGGYRQGMALVWMNRTGVFKSFFCMEAADKDSSIGRAFFLRFTHDAGGWHYAGYNELKGGDADVEEQLQELSDMIYAVKATADDANPVAGFDGFVESATVQQKSTGTWSRIVFVKSSNQFAAQNGLDYYLGWNVPEEDKTHGMPVAYGSTGKTHLLTTTGQLYVRLTDGSLGLVGSQEASDELADLVKNGRNWYRYGAVRAPQLFALTTAASSDEVKAALTDIQGNHPKQAGLDACITGRVRLCEYVMGGTVMVGWSGQGYVLTYVGQLTPASQVYACTITVSATDTGGETTYAVVRDGSRVLLSDVTAQLTALQEETARLRGQQCSFTSIEESLSVSDAEAQTPKLIVYDKGRRTFVCLDHDGNYYSSWASGDDFQNPMSDYLAGGTGGTSSAPITGKLFYCVDEEAMYYWAAAELYKLTGEAVQ